MSTATRAVGVGVFVVSGVALLAVSLFMIGDRQMAFSETFTLYTEFTKITGLQPGAIVRVSGAKAGTIVQILPPGRPSQKFRVRLELVESLHQLVRTDSVATIETEGLVGGNYLGIGTGTDAAPRAAPHSTIAGREPFDIADLMQQMGTTISTVNETIDAMKGDVQNAVVVVASTMGNANALITDVSDDVKRMTASGARVVNDVAAVAEGVRAGRGLVGKLMTDDELYTRVTAVARHVEETAAQTTQVVEAARRSLEMFQSKEGPVQGMAADVGQTMNDARSAMAAFAENMEALKHNFLLRGYFNRRGYFDLAQISPAAYRAGALSKGDGRQMVRTWLGADELFEADSGTPEAERLTARGQERVATAIGLSLTHVVSGVVIVEGYAQAGRPDQQYLRARSRALLVRDHLIGAFHLDPGIVGAMPLGADSAGSPGRAPWDGVALAVILPKGTLVTRK